MKIWCSLDWINPKFLMVQILTDSDQIYLKVLLHLLRLQTVMGKPSWKSRMRDFNKKLDIRQQSDLHLSSKRISDLFLLQVRTNVKIKLGHKKRSQSCLDHEMRLSLIWIRNIIFSIIVLIGNFLMHLESYSMSYRDL